MGRPDRKPARRQPLPRKPAWGAIALTAIPIAIAVALTNRDEIEDRLNLVPNPPSAEVERLAQATTMTPLAQRLFYRQDPTLEPRSTFLAQCNVPPETIVLGCYLQERQGQRILGGKIVIQAIDDPQFAGIMEVTAAHEMLHAAYDRLTPTQQQRLFEQLQQALENVTNERLLNLLQDYKAKDLNLYRHELHSHLGTELPTLGNPELEAHYRRYFRDRRRVVAFAEQSVRLITRFEQQAEALGAAISQLEQQLQAAQQELETLAARLKRSGDRLTQDQAQLEQTQAAAQTALVRGDGRSGPLFAQFERDQARFNRDVDDHNAQVAEYQQQVERFNQSLEQYRQNVDAYNQLAQDSRKALEGLAGSLDALPRSAQPLQR